MNTEQSVAASEQKEEDELSHFFSSGLLHKVLCLVGLAKVEAAAVKRRVLFLVLLTFLPLLILSAIQGVAWSGVHIPFLYDVAELTRFLFIGPALIIAEVIVEPWLIQGVRYTREKLVPVEQMDEFRTIVARAIRLRDSVPLELLLLVIVFIWQWSDVVSQTQIMVNTWHQLPSNRENSYAWSYYYYFAKPLVRFLWLRWLWRYLIWSLMLCRLPSLNLRLMAAHPDRHGGLLFLAKCHQRFVVLAFIFGAQIAGIFGEQILANGKNLFNFKNEIIGTVLNSLLDSAAGFYR